MQWQLPPEVVEQVQFLGPSQGQSDPDPHPQAILDVKGGLCYVKCFCRCQYLALMTDCCGVSGRISHIHLFLILLINVDINREMKKEKKRELLVL